ncbi:MAG: hypothetical protein IPJ02_08570 [Chitinophagaceae bacterium]|nr:hypothetical protein [Chitinophagaceae bacterium]
MNKSLSLILLIVGQILFYSCHIAHDKEIICYDNLKKARDLAYKNPDNKASLDSALIIVNRCMKCDSIKAAAVELKIRLLITLGKFKEGSDFIDSLQVTDFTYPYKKKLYHDNFLARNFASNKDTVNRDMVYKQMTAYLNSYINNNNLKSKEFQEAFTELNSLMENLNNSVTDRQIESLKIKYPDEVKFLDFFKH